MRIIIDLWKKQPGKFFCISTKSKSGAWKDNFFKRSELDQVEEFIKDRLDSHDIYFCPHGFRLNRRLKKYAVMPRMLWADLDEVNIKRVRPKPTIAIESSPGRYVGLWRTDRFVNEGLNQRLTYHVGADQGGWDITQVLRVPGTLNHKYINTPTVHTIWEDGPAHRLKNLERILPDVAGAGDSSSTETVKSIYAEWEKRLSPWCRRELLTGKAKPGKRSEVFHRLVQELIEVGVTQAETYELIKASPWNKFAGRRDEEKQLRREIDKVISKKLTIRITDGDREAGRDKLVATRLSDVVAKNHNWIWYPYLARGEMTILEGDPGLGKSYMAQMIAKSLCDDDNLPQFDKYKKRNHGNKVVLYCDVENDSATVTKRRLDDNSCQCPEHYYQLEETFSIGDEEKLDQLYELCEELKPSLIVFDTMNHYLGSIDSHKASEVTQTLAEFKVLAKETNSAVLVIRHLTKSNKTKAIYRGQGSIAFTGFARIVMTVGRHPEDEDLNFMAVTKLNIAPEPPALTYEIRRIRDAETFRERSKFVWGTFDSEVSVEAINEDPKKDKKKPTDRQEAEVFLQDLLGDNGPMVVTKVRKAAEAKGVRERTLYRAADSLGVKRVQRGKGKGRLTWWSLPPSCTPKRGRR